MTVEMTTTDPLSRLDPEIAEFVRRSDAAGAGSPALGDVPPAVSRKAAELARAQWYEGGPGMAEILDMDVPTSYGPIHIRIYKPKEIRGSGCFVYLPGGGWALFSTITHDRLMREYAARTGMIVIGVDYTRAPEVRFPRPVEEVDDVLGWLFDHAGELGFSADQVALGGDSAGGNLVAACCICRRDEGRKLPACTVYNYGSFDMGEFKSSVLKYGGGAYLLGSHEMLWFKMNYFNTAEEMLHPWASPLRAAKTGLPATFMAIAEFDPLYDDNLAWAKALRDTGVDVTAVVYPGTVHSFLEAMSIAEVSRRAIAETSVWLSGMIA
ncbi:alpha/beta hydrolase [Mesorhizobium sp. NZP2298]|uniref:alpha/beta hydrolase n=1 Tax=Mesorhizobium sp. NZP2298 TaxID=2483403 RepID=UPI00155373A2|nr:alpha/beta hydrolase [Mesorhizobium sp. NZP2298]QKC98325.1 alpha/beta hydrolase [Mesorhizobium sp. NZP2298]